MHPITQDFLRYLYMREDALTDKEQVHRDNTETIIRTSPQADLFFDPDRQARRLALLARGDTLDDMARTPAQEAEFMAVQTELIESIRAPLAALDAWLEAEYPRSFIADVARQMEADELFAQIRFGVPQ